MKPFKLISKQAAFISLHSTLVRVLAILLAFNLSLAMTADAQRRGGGGSRGSISRGHMGNYHGYYGGHYRGHYGGHYLSRPYWGFSYFPIWGDFYWGISPFALRFMYNNLYYYFDDGIYYRLDNDKYQVVPAPVGHRIKKLPKGTYELTVNGAPYYYYFGTFYIPVDKQYEIVEPPIGAMVETIPQGYEKLDIEGQTYYISNGVQYKAVMRNNEVWYQVIKNNSPIVDPTNPSKEMNTVPTENPEHK